MSTDLAGLEAQISTLVEKEAVGEALNEYARLVDAKRWDAWVELFTDDIVIEFPFARHEGKSGLGQWAGDALGAFEITQHMSSNFQIEIDGDRASARSNLWAACVHSRQKAGDHFDEGGVYLWNLEREGGSWLISSVSLDVVWTQGADVAQIAS
jgi:3-phenylpropionate/cinnamic acid dioxygenase small subunit